MTKKQCSQFNSMRNALLRIKEYQSPKKLRRDSEKDWGLPFLEAMEMAYENIQCEAANAVKGVWAVSLKEESPATDTQQLKAEIRSLAYKYRCAEIETLDFLDKLDELSAV